MRVVAIAALLLFASAIAPVGAQDADMYAAWRPLFRREGNPPAPPDNPLNPEKVMLGARLFADPRLSGDGNRSCATCHRLDRAFTDGRRRPLALSRALLARNTPTLFNLAWSRYYFWDGRAPSLEIQVGMPIEAADEMRGDWPTILRRLGEDAELVRQFRGAFGGEASPSQSSIRKALASYVRSLVSPRTRFDAFVEGDARALRPAEVRGFGLFVGKAACVLCHVGWRFTDDRFHDIGLRSKDAGRGAVAGGTPGLKAFKTPSLRELTHTAPYMHDGSLPTLAAVIKHYSGGFVVRPSLATQLNHHLRLAAREQGDLIAFLRTLSSESAPARSQGAAGLR